MNVKTKLLSYGWPIDKVNKLTEEQLNKIIEIIKCWEKANER